MNKTFFSVLILALTIIGAVILYGVVFNKYPTFGTFENLVFLGLVTFGLGIGIYVSALLLEQAIKDSRK